MKVKNVNTSVPDDVNIGAIPPAHLTLAGHVNEYAPAFTTVNVNPNAFDTGGLLNVIVDVPVNTLLKLFAVVKSNVIELPEPKSEYVSLNIVDVVAPLIVTFPVVVRVLPSKVILVFTLPLAVELT